MVNEKLYERCKLLRWYGIDRDKRNYKGKDFRLENDITEYGYKFHMNDINATIGMYNLPHMDYLLEKNRKNAAYLDENLNDGNFKKDESEEYCKFHPYNQGRRKKFFIIKLTKNIV